MELLILVVNTVETGYKVTAYKVKSDIKLSFHSTKVPF